MGLKSRDEGTDDSDGEHPDIHRVVRIALVSDDADRKVYPDQQARGLERDTSYSATSSNLM
jgi:hypothetical protein